MPSVIWSVPARDDLRGINDWMRREASAAFAIRTLAAIRHRAEFLRNFPHGGRPYKDGNRILRVFDTPYLILYAIGKDGVEVRRVHHEREDWFVEP